MNFYNQNIIYNQNYFDFSVRQKIKSYIIRYVVQIYPPLRQKRTQVHLFFGGEQGILKPKGSLKYTVMKQICFNIYLQAMKKVFYQFLQFREMQISSKRVKQQRAVAIAPWVHLRLPSCSHGFESEAHHLCLFQFVLFKLY